MAKIADLSVRIDPLEIKKVEDHISKLRNTEYHLRRKIKRYKKHVKELEKAVKWRNTVIEELMRDRKMCSSYVFDALIQANLSFTDMFKIMGEVTKND